MAGYSVKPPTLPNGQPNAEAILSKSTRDVKVSSSDEIVPGPWDKTRQHDYFIKVPVFIGKWGQTCIVEGLAAALIQSQVAETSGLKSLLEKQGFKAKDWREEETDIRNKGMVTSFLNQTGALVTSPDGEDETISGHVSSGEDPASVEQRTGVKCQGSSSGSGSGTNAYKIEPKMLEDAASLKQQYNIAVHRILAQHAVQTGLEVWSRFVMNHSK
ncbi:MAG: hypothetical protein LQ350_005488 [Teloschistes chrysophthalmus]|nr:MAG: hypothetical protein LQ350_005488 [Niorma chrysophthalma]